MLDNEPRTIIEAKLGDEWRRVAACSNPRFDGEVMVLERVVIARRPEFTIRPVGVEDWLKKKLLLVTTIRETPKSHSTTSWACRFIGAKSVSDMGDVCAITDMTLQL